MIAKGDVKGKLSKADLPTPALIVDIDAFESNVKKMVTYVKGKGRAIRPHGKTHKCPEIAKYIIGQGAVGACAAKLSEAEAFAENGVKGLLVTTAVVGKHKIERAVAMARKHPDIIYCVDNAQNAQDLNDAAGQGKVRLNVALDLWVGRRTGILRAMRRWRWAKPLRSFRICGYTGYRRMRDMRRTSMVLRIGRRFRLKR